MKKYWKRLIYRSEDELFNPLMHIFFFISLAFGISFAIAPVFFGATSTVLYAQTAIHFGRFAGSLWGWGLILATLMNTVMLVTRTPFLGGITAGLGFMLWFYALLTYAFAMFWIGLLAAAIPNMLFWVWYYFRVKAYHRRPPNKV